MPAMDFGFRTPPRWLEDPKKATFHLRSLDAPLLEQALSTMKELILLTP